MFKKVLLLITVVLLSVNGSVYATDHATVAHWKLDETTGDGVIDEMSNSNGTLVNMTGNEWVAGQDGNALDFSLGVDTSYTKVDHNAMVDFDSTESFTVSLLMMSLKKSDFYEICVCTITQ